jgi:hypothetical protein
MEMPSSVSSPQGTARGSRPLQEHQGSGSRTLRSRTEGAKVAGQAGGPRVIPNEDDTDPAARQADLYMDIQANGDPARRDAGPISYV